MSRAKGLLLEKYTAKRPEEVLIVTIEVAGEEDQVMIYNGFSSSLVRPTSFDPDIPIIPPEANIIAIDRLASPYNPEQPTYIQSGLSWSQMESFLTEMGI